MGGYVKKKLVFFFPWRQVSGGPYYLARLANGIADKGIYDVYYTDYERGLCTSILTNPDIKVLIYRNEGSKFEIFVNEPVIIVMPVYWAHIVPVAHADSKIVFFNWHNECIPVLDREWITTPLFMEKFIKLLADTDAEFFLDKAHWMAQQKYGPICKEQYVPVAIPKRTIKAKMELVNKERNIAILGRLVQDKIYAVLDLIDSIVELRDGIKTNIYIIGEGDYEHLVFNQTFPDNINIIRCGTMKINDIIKMISHRIDILFGMGTSVLDGASIGIPSVILPNAMEMFRCNKYPFLYETTGYALGWYPDQIHDLKIKTHSIKEIFDCIYKEDKKREVGELCYKYYLKNHTENIELFDEAIQSSKLTIKEYRNFVKKNRTFKLVVHRLMPRLMTRLRTIHGKSYRQLKIFGFPVYTLAKTTDNHINLYVCCIPLLRINKYGEMVGVNFLLLVWIVKSIVAIMRRIRERKSI